MRKSLVVKFCLLIFSLWISNAFAQKQIAETEYINLTRDFFKSIGLKSSHLLYAKPFLLESSDCLIDLKNDSEIFTAQELIDIEKKIKDPQIKMWTNQILKKQKIIINSNNFETFYEYSSPIFLRNNSYCLFYLEKHCDGGLCGNGGLTLYIKRKNKWIKARPYCSFYN